MKKIKKKKWKVKFTPGFLEDCKRLFSNNPRYAIPRFFSNTWFEIRMGCQRLTRGYDDRWNWELRGMLEEVIPKCVRWIKKNGIGCCEDLYDEKRKGNECWRWKDILEKIAQGFEAKEKIYQNLLYKGKRYEKLKAKEKEGMKLFVKYFDNLWD